jgi:hypothetical protein
VNLDCEVVFLHCIQSFFAMLESLYYGPFHANVDFGTLTVDIDHGYSPCTSSPSRDLDRKRLLPPAAAYAVQARVDPTPRTERTRATSRSACARPSAPKSSTTSISSSRSTAKGTLSPRPPLARARIGSQLQAEEGNPNSGLMRKKVEERRDCWHLDI